MTAETSRGILVLVETESHIAKTCLKKSLAKAVFELVILLPPSPSARITGLCYHAQIQVEI